MQSATKPQLINKISPLWKTDVFPVIFLVGFFVSVFVYWPWAKVEYEIPKVWFTQRWIEVLLIISVFSFAKGLKKEKLDTVLISFVLLFLLWVVFSALLGIDFQKSISGNYYRADGIINLLHLAALFLVVSLFYKKDLVLSYVKLVSLSSVILSFVTVCCWLGFYVFDFKGISVWQGAFGLAFGNPNFLAGYLIVTLPLTYFLVRKPLAAKKNKFLKAAFTVQILGILITKSWAGVFGIYIFWLLVQVYEKGMNIRRILISILVLTSLLGGYFVYRKHIETPGIVIAESRERIFTKGILAYLKRPVSGWGWANFDYAFNSVSWPIKMNNDVYVDKAHSSLLEVLVTTGGIGLLFYLAIIYRVVSNLGNKKSELGKYLLITFILTAIHLQLNVVSVTEDLVFWIIAAFSVK